jgi:hypothetical protein
VIGIKIKKVGIFINPKLNGTLILRYVPEIAKPTAPIKAIKNPIAAEVPIATFIGYPNILNIGVLNTPPPIPMGADKKPDKKPQTTL